MQHQYYTENQLSIDYITYGEGPEVILAFHGFGRHPEDFEVFSQLLQADQQLISIYLFQHGQSHFPENRIPDNPLQKDEFAAFILGFLKKLKVQKIHLFGYSLGGKVCMCLLEKIPERILSLNLFAPDGLKINPVYRLSSQTVGGRALYRAIVHYPRPFFQAANLAHWSGIISHQVHRFVKHHMDTFDKRKQVYDTWLIYRDFNPDLAQIRKLADIHKTPLLLFLGKYDRIIPPDHANRLCHKWREDSVHILESGHLLLNQSTVNYLRDHNLWPHG